MRAAIILLIIVFSSHQLIPGAPHSSAEEKDRHVEPPAKHHRTDRADELIAQGDRFHRDMDVEQSLRSYEKAFAMDSDNAEILWRLSRACYLMGKRAEERKDRGEYFTKAEQYARKAVAIDPDNAKGHLWISISVGMVALFRGGKEKVELSREVKGEAEKAIELDSREDIAYHVLARWHVEVANLNWFLKGFAKLLYGGLPPASKEEGIRLFKKAISLKPEWIHHHLELGKTYLQVGKREKARNEFETVLSLPSVDVEDAHHREEARILLKQYETD
jgi:tetratricopeptide (TPR) repeat protein